MIQHNILDSLQRIVFCLAFTCLSIVTEIESKPRLNKIDTIKNNTLQIGINLDAEDEKFGSIVEITTQLHKSFNHMNLFSPRMGSTYATNKTLVRHSNDTISILYSDFGSVRFGIQLQYHLENDRVIIVVHGSVMEQCSVTQGLELDFDNTCAQVLSQVIGFSPQILTLRDRQRYCNQIQAFINHQDTLYALIRNPFHSNWKINNQGNGKHSLVIFDTLHPRGPLHQTTLEGPVISNHLNKNEILERRIELFLSKAFCTPLVWSEHPFGFAPTLTMFWDELPGWNWEIMTTEDNGESRQDRFFVRLLKEHPQLKMGYLFMTDRILNVGKSTIDAWSVNSPLIIPDSLEKIHGTWCLSFIPEKKEKLRCAQYLRCEPQTSYVIQCRIKNEISQGAGGVVSVFAKPSNKRVASLQINTPYSNSWENTMNTEFQTESQDTLLEVELCIDQSSGRCFFDDIRLMKRSSEANLLVNGSFETCKPSITYDNKRRHWVDAQGNFRLATESSQQYREFLKRLDQHTLVYGWEDRVKLGCHGHHHSVSPSKPDPQWEFQYYSPEHDALSVEKIFADCKKVGLSRESLRFWRSPGGKYTNSLIPLLIDSGFVFIAPPGNRHYTHFESKRIQHHTRSSWIVSEAWIADMDSFDDKVKLDRYLQQGHIGHIAGHPERIFKGETEQSYQRFHSILADYEKTYPNLGYVFPDEYADNAEALYNLGTDVLSITNDTISMQITGKIRKGSTLFFNGTVRSVLIDGHQVLQKNVGKTTFIVLPSLPLGTHMLRLVHAEITGNSVPLIAEHTKVESPLLIFTKNALIVSRRQQNQAPIILSITNAAGKCILHKQINCAQSAQTVSLSPLAQGIYFIRIHANGEHYRTKMVTLNREYSIVFR